MVKSEVAYIGQEKIKTRREREAESNPYFVYCLSTAWFNALLSERKWKAVKGKKGYWRRGLPIINNLSEYPEIEQAVAAWKPQTERFVNQSLRAMPYVSPKSK